MGRETLPDSDPEPEKKADQRRSASESKVSKEYRFIDDINFQLKQSQPSKSQANGVMRQNNAGRKDRMNGKQVDPKQFTVRNAAKPPQRGGGIGQRKSLSDSSHFFLEPKQTVSIYGEMEKRLNMREIDEPSKDQDALSQLLEAKLKELLHLKKISSNPPNLRNFVDDESPVVVMKPGIINRQGRPVGDSSASSFRSRTGPPRNLILSNDMSPAVNPRRDSPEVDRNHSPSSGRNAMSPFFFFFKYSVH